MLTILFSSEVYLYLILFLQHSTNSSSDPHQIFPTQKEPSYQVRVATYQWSLSCVLYVSSSFQITSNLESEINNYMLIEANSCITNASLAYCHRLSANLEWNVILAVAKFHEKRFIVKYKIQQSS